MPPHSKRSRHVLALLLTAGVLIVATVLLILSNANIAPRQLAPYIERRAQGHNIGIEKIAQEMSHYLQQVDRGAPLTRDVQAWTIGAQPVATIETAAIEGVVQVSTVGELKQAIDMARPGQVISLLPGRYRINGDGSLNINQAGKEDAPIVIRAERPATVFIDLNAGEGFKVNAPYWTIENLTIQGVCKEQEFCQHAFHVVGKGAHFTARNNSISNFNAHFKINGEDNAFPDFGVIEGNTLTNTAPRRTTSPVTPIDLVAASHWRITRNVISDFIKADGDHISYGAFVKGGGRDNRISQNIVLCEYMLQGHGGQQVGLSLGGGGTGPQYCRDRRCITEQDGGVIEANLIASCTDDGIYLNRAAASKIIHNTMIDTGGISVRFAESTADIEGNLIDSLIRPRDDGLVRATENMITGPINLYLGRHPVRDLFDMPNMLQLGWKKVPPLRKDVEGEILDLCQGPRRQQASYGAFENFSACKRVTKK